jgi:hypothetical protein
VGKENLSTDQANQHWSIDLDWFQSNNRSFLALAQRCLCPKCREQLKEEMSATDLLANIKDCCSKTPDFFTVELPILESIFRLFLANGNKPLDVEELSKQLGKWHRGDTPRTSPKVLTRLLESDQYYGLREAKD